MIIAAFLSIWNLYLGTMISVLILIVAAIFLTL